MKELRITFHIMPMPETIDDLIAQLIISADHMQLMLDLKRLPTIMALRDKNGELRGTVSFSEHDVSI